jgi:L,D-peptidoglycan transpeptidase YkuD (ErfK/YbiS/YcfS/YnhG family)
MPKPTQTASASSRAQPGAADSVGSAQPQNVRTKARVRLLGVLVGSLALLLAGPSLMTAQGATYPQSSPLWRACTKKLDGITTSIARSQRTVTIVNQTSKTYARVSFWIRTNSACTLSRKFLTTTGRIGYGGTVDGDDRKQGTGTTPLGTYTMTSAFGNGPAPDTWLPYHRVRSGDYWVGDNQSSYYNTLRNKAKGGFRWWLPQSSVDSSEKLSSYGSQYRYVVVINFNRAPDYQRHYRGSGIFLHVKGSGATAGCVAITATQMRTVMAYMHVGDKITIAR